MREPQAYRDNLERLIEHFPASELINKKEAAEFLGINYRTKYLEDLPFHNNYISKATLARIMASGT